MNAVSKCPKCYDEAMGCNTGEIDQNGYLDCLCGAADARVAMEKELGLFEAPQWARDKAWRAYSMGVAATEARMVPGGWKLVPIDATETMVHAAEDLPAPRMFGPVYRAMIGAAPEVTS